MKPVPQPELVKISVYEFTISYDPAEMKQWDRRDSSDHLGVSDMAQHRIVIDDSRPLRAMQATLMHEIVHCILWAYGADPKDIAKLDDPEESLVSLVDHAFLAVLRENPDVVAWLTS